MNESLEKNNLLELKNINLTIDGHKILENISLSLEKGKIKTLIGINGGGKTTLARIIIGAIKASHGEIIKQKNIKIGHMPQKIQVDKTIPMTVLDFIKLVNDKNLDDNLQSWCRRLKIENILNKQIHEISGGQLQKILFLQAVCGNNDLLILDEPTQFMDISAVNEFYKILEEIRTASNCGILLISHDLHLVMQKTDMVYCLNRHLCCQGKPEDINKHPEYLALLDNSLQFKNGSEIAFYSHHHDHIHKI